MYCERCNVDFPEGLRYCKWCGQELVERQRSTGELQACPVCSSAIKPNWVFCKSCGANLAQVSKEAPKSVCSRCGSSTTQGDLYCLQCGHEMTRRFDSQEEKSDTANALTLIAKCPSCGEALEAGFKYCKGCGVPLPEGLVPQDDSSLLCEHCNRYSPSGSQSCAVCGSSLAGARSFSHIPTAEFHPHAKARPDTLPDLADHLPDFEAEDQAARTEESASAPRPGFENEAATFIFEGNERTEEIASFPAHGDEKVDLQSHGRMEDQAASSTVEMESLSSKNEPRADSGATESSRSDKPQEENQPLTVFIHKRKAASPAKEEEKTEQEIFGTVPISDASMETRLDIEALRSSQQEGFYLEDEPQEATVSRSLEEVEPAETETSDGSDEQPAPGFAGTQQIGAGFMDFEALQEEPPPVEEDKSPAPSEREPLAETFIFTGLEDEGTVPLSEEQAESVLADASPALAESAPQGNETQEEPKTEMPFDTGAFGDRTRPETRLPTESVANPGTSSNPVPVHTSMQQGSSSPASFAQSAAPVAGAPRTPTRTPAPGRKSGLIIASSVAAVLAIAVIAYVVWAFILKDGTAESGNTEPQVTETPPATQTTPPVPPAPAVPEGMVKVAGGNYVIGRDDGDELGRPAYSIALPAFYIDRTEVTNAAYKAFVDATARKAPEEWKDGTYEEGRDNWPVTGVTWQDAADYAAWTGKRLPTEEEWEAAARGTDARIYSWGNEWDPTRANISANSIKEVGQYENGASSAGALDMIGNVWEWTDSEFKLYPNSPASLPALKSDVTYRVIRGGAYDGNKIHTASYRGYVDGSKSFTKTGFRCAKDASP